MTARHVGNYKAGANIVIEDSNFVDSSFALGMVYVPPAQRFLDPKKDVLYAHEHNQKAEYAGAVSQMDAQARDQRQIIASSSRFSNLNYGKYLQSLASLKPDKNLFS